MVSDLVEVPKFRTDKEFQATKARIEELVREGALKECGLDPAEMVRFVEVYEGSNGDKWRLAIPDHAFRGYLKKEPSSSGSSG